MTTFTPTWSSNVNWSLPQIGEAGQITGKFSVDDDGFHVSIDIKPGEDTRTGDGAYVVGLPFTPADVATWMAEHGMEAPKR